MGHRCRIPPYSNSPNLQVGWDTHGFKSLPGFFCVLLRMTVHVSMVYGVMALSVMELQLGVFRFLTTTHAETKAIKMHLWSLCTVLCFTHVYLHAQTTVQWCTWQITVILIAGKTWIPQLESLCLDKNGAGSGISSLYLSVVATCSTYLMKSLLPIIYIGYKGKNP